MLVDSRRLSLSFWLALFALIGCADAEPRTQLLIWVRADTVVAQQLAQVRVALYGDSEIKREARFDIGDGELQLPFSFGVALGRSYTFELVVRGYASREDGAPVIVERRTRPEFRPRITRELTVQLSARDLVCGDVPIPGCATREDAGPDPLPPSDAGRDASPGPTPDEEDARPLPDTCARGPGGDVCDPVQRCGCAGAAQCQVDDDRGACAVPGMLGQGEVCARNRDCAAGLSCMAGACRTACRSEADCEAENGQPSACVRRAGAHFGFCAQPCAKPGAPACASGLICSPLRAEAVQDSFCVRLELPCSSADDDQCDEPGRGTGFCAAGSDANDCCYEPQPKGWCDLITQCGCAKDQACHPVGLISSKDWETGCTAGGSLPIGSRCTLDTQCERGAGCIGSICKRYCSPSDSGSCEDGTCLELVKEVIENEGVGGCVPACDWDTQAGCLPGTVCAQLRTGLGCHVQPEECPWRDDNVCDEPTRLCREGTDSDADCNR